MGEPTTLNVTAIIEYWDDGDLRNGDRCINDYERTSYGISESYSIL